VLDPQQFDSIAAKVQAMSISVTIRDVPDDVRDELAARAARAGQSLQEYLRSMLVDSVARPPLADVLARARLRVKTTGSRVDADAILSALAADRR
jgi:antitoxin FitA